MIGLCLPALFTALMTFVASSATAETLRQSLAWYIAATILGGFAGRALSGLVASVWDWRVALGISAPALLVMGLWTLRLPGAPREPLRAGDAARLPGRDGGGPVPPRPIHGFFNFLRLCAC